MTEIDRDTSDWNTAVSSLTASWQLGMLVGVIMIVLGIIVTAHPTTSLNVICVLIGILVLIGGIFRLIRSLNPNEGNRALTAVVGVVMMVVGVILIRHLDLSRALIGLVVGIAFIVQGAADLFAGLSDEGPGGRAWPIIAGIVSIAAGIVVVVVPESSVTVLAVLIGIWFIVLGGLQVIAAFALRHELKRATA